MTDKTFVSAASLAKWAHKKDMSLKALRAGWSVGAVARAYETPPRVITHWRKEAGITPAVQSRCRPTPAVGEVLA